MTATHTNKKSNLRNKIDQHHVTSQLSTFVDDNMLEQIIERIKSKLINDISNSLNIRLISESLKSTNNQLINSKSNLTITSYQTTQDQFLSNIKNNFKNYGINMSTREIECIALCLNGKTAKEIGKILKISHRTVRTHFEKSYIKLGITTKAQLYDLAMVKQAYYLLNEFYMILIGKNEKTIAV